MSQLVLLVGPTGAGKTMQGDALVGRHPTWRHISSGVLLRADPAAAGYLARGELAPSVEVERLVTAALEQAADSPYLILDGFPRNLEEASWLDQYAAAHHHRFAAVFIFDIAREVIEERLLHRLRSDDGRAAIETKLREYEARTQPMIKYYEREGTATHLDGALPVAAIAEAIETRLHV